MIYQFYTIKKSCFHVMKYSVQVSLAFKKRKEFLVKVSKTVKVIFIVFGVGIFIFLKRIMYKTIIHLWLLKCCKNKNFIFIVYFKFMLRVLSYIFHMFICILCAFLFLLYIPIFIQKIPIFIKL